MALEKGCDLVAEVPWLVTLLKPYADAKVLTPSATFLTALVALLTVTLNIIAQRYQLNKRIAADKILKKSEIAANEKITNAELESEKQKVRFSEINTKLEKIAVELLSYEMAIGEVVRDFERTATQLSPKELEDKLNTIEDQLSKYKNNHLVKALTLTHFYMKELYEESQFILLREECLQKSFKELREKLISLVPNKNDAQSSDNQELRIEVKRAIKNANKDEEALNAQSTRLRVNIAKEAQKLCEYTHSVRI